ncbi:MAG: FAD-dependent monooxygenase [Rhodoferax sp.]|uniref:FAD-dependent monooxygenase n=1 Tax=Rhodoferax sp. TaxID=50421 RepID=UPI002612DFDF|nr:FAD-dependent monooxygenase [Rhodoferax sp.]MDD5336622.1 FAD-dependent monooxygenase [Rhodoferax sp.]
MNKRILVVGGGIGGLAAALACSRAGTDAALFERASAFSEVGAGIQLGPNVVKVLQGWGLQDALKAVAAFPQRLQVRSAMTGQELGVLRLGAATVQRYGAPYATIHRADLHALLLAALKQGGDMPLNLDSEVAGFVQHDTGVMLRTTDGRQAQGAALVGADGLWSRVRQQLLGDAAPVASGHLAYRALVAQSSLPEKLRSHQVTVWLGPAMHAVQYPVQAGASLNVVVIVTGRVPGDIASWDHAANSANLRRSLAHACSPLQELLQAIAHWRLWGLSIRPPMRGPWEQAQNRVALLGDAAHPMVPYLAQGAGMAIEDAQALAQSLAASGVDVVTALRHYANARWQRNARVQAGALRNGQIFHATGLLRWGRDAAMKVLGEHLLDMPWLYRGPA